MDLSDFRSKKVLVVDDFANVRKSIKSMLQDLGIPHVQEATEGNMATKAVSETIFDLILCDYNLGKGRDGARLLEEWRVRKLIGPNVIFVLITAETSRSVVISAMEFQPDDYLAKPFTMEVLSTRIVRWFDRRQVLLPLMVSLDKGDWQAVAESAWSIIDEHPRFRSIAQKQYCEALIQQNMLTEAENFLHGLLDKRFQSWAQAALHRIDLIQNKHEAAEVGLVEVLVADPNLLEAYDFLAASLKAQNKKEELQTCLEDAVQRAPHNIDRQRELVLTAQANLDFKRSNNAMKEIIQMAADTMHQSLGDYQIYVKNLQIEARNCSSEPRLREIKKEITTTSKKIIERYQDDPNARLFNKALVVQNDSDPIAARHTKSLNEIFKTSFELLDDIIAETALFVTETFYLAERFNDGDEMVRQFKIKFKDNPDVLTRFDELQAEPVSVEKREQAKELNLKGIEFYKQKQFSESIRYFDQAMTLSPRHPGIILNYVQSHLLRMKEEALNPKEIELCIECINRLNYLPVDHYQYDRYAKLRNNIKNLK